MIVANSVFLACKICPKDLSNLDLSEISNFFQIELKTTLESLTSSFTCSTGMASYSARISSVAGFIVVIFTNFLKNFLKFIDCEMNLKIESLKYFSDEKINYLN
jgi:hypothetical protein